MGIGPIGNQGDRFSGPLGNMTIAVTGAGGGGGGAEDIDPARESLADWDERFEKWKRDRWKLIANLCEPCAIRKSPDLASQKRRELDLQRRAQHAGPVGITGRTGHTCDSCGGYRFEGWDR
jgi:hypothetical protein